MGKKKLKTREKAEIKRLKSIFIAIPEDKMALVDGLIAQAARLRVSLDDIWEDICDKGDLEDFQQSPHVPAYQRERPAARLFNARDKNYTTIIKQLVEYLPDKSQQDDAVEQMYRYVYDQNAPESIKV